MKPSALTEEKQKKERHKRRHFTLRINMFFFFTFLLFSILIVRLAYLQFVEGKAFAESEKMSTNRDITISPIRGNIYDSKGAPIAYTISAESLFYRMESTQLKADVMKKQQVELAIRLEQIFTQLDPKNNEPLTASEIIKNMDVGIDIEGKKTAKAPGTMFIPRRIKTKLSNEEIAYISEHRDELPGLEISEESTRVYHEDKIAVQLLGYMRPFNTATKDLNFYKNSETEYLTDEYVGYDGLEFMYQNDLRGKNGSKSYPVNATAQIIGKVKITPPEKGHNLKLSIDHNVQLAAQNAVRNHLEFLQSSKTSPTDYFSLGNKAVAGYAVAIEVDTGRVMAMVNYPDYDPNLWIGGMSSEEWKENSYRYTNGAIKERYADIQDEKMRNKHPSSLVPPGSTLKPLSVLVALNEGIITPAQKYNDLGVFEYGKEKLDKVSNSDGRINYQINAAQAIAVSSNTFMAAMVGHNLNNRFGGTKAIEIWDSYMKKFGLGVLTGSGLPFESSGDIYYKDNKGMSNQTALVFGSFGQSARYTTLQLAQYTSMLANRGKRYKPLFVDEITTYNGELIKKVEPELLNEEKISEAYWKVLESGMSEVGVTGFDGVTYTFNRKTGTSQQQIAGKTLDNAVFIAYAPAVNPKLAIAIVVPEGGFGRYGASPIARQIFDAYDQYIGLDGIPKGGATPSPIVVETSVKTQ